MRFAVYDITGKISRVGFCAEQDLKYQAGEGEFIIEISPEVTELTHEIKNDTAVRLDKPLSIWGAVDPWKQLRRDRNALLSACDWTQVADAPVDREAWAAYRQQLRDITDGFSDPEAVIWPTPPS
jgi:hypothetical protein